MYHGILLKKSYHYKIRGVTRTWFQSYLINRQQTTGTVLPDICSDFEMVTCTIPQGSVL